MTTQYLDTLYQVYHVSLTMYYIYIYIYISDAPIPLFSNRSDTDTFQVENGRYQFDTNTLVYKYYSQKTGSNLI